MQVFFEFFFEIKSISIQQVTSLQANFVYIFLMLFLHLTSLVEEYSTLRFKKGAGRSKLSPQKASRRTQKTPKNQTLHKNKTKIILNKYLHV